MTDYELFLEENNLTEDMVSALSNVAEDLVFVEMQDVALLGESAIHGLGLFATRPIKNGEVIAAARFLGLRTQAGRFINHSGDPNVEFFAIADDIIVKAIAHIAPGAELLVDYRQALSVNKSLEELLK